MFKFTSVRNSRYIFIVETFIKVVYWKEFPLLSKYTVTNYYRLWSVQVFFILQMISFMLNGPFEETFPERLISYFHLNWWSLARRLKNDSVSINETINCVNVPVEST